jgi:hypothetical protein
MKQYKRIGDWLIDCGLIDESQLYEAIEAQQGTGIRLGEMVVKMGFVSENAITAGLAEQYELEIVDAPMKLRPQKEALRLISPTFALARLVLPYKLDSSHLECVVVDPIDFSTTDELNRLVSRRIELRLARPTELYQAIIKHYKFPLRVVEGGAPAGKPIATDPQSDRRELLMVLENAAPESSFWQKIGGGR